MENHPIHLQRNDNFDSTIQTLTVFLMLMQIVISIILHGDSSTSFYSFNK